MNVELMPFTEVALFASRDTRFDLFTETDVEQVESALAGVVPFLVRCRDSALVWGFEVLRRTAGTREGTPDYVPVLKADGNDEEMVVLALRAERRRDRYTWRERAGVLAISDGDMVRDLLSSEGDPRPAVERFRMLPSHLQAAVDGELIDIRSAESAQGIDPIVFRRLVELVKNRSFSRRRTFLIQFVELLQREEYAEQRRANTEALQSELCSLLEEAENPEAELRRLRYPVLTEMERVVAKFTNRYLAGSGISLQTPQSFEGDRYTFTLPFRTETEFRRRLEVLNDAGEGIGEILELLF